MSVAINLAPDMYAERILKWIEGGKHTVRKNEESFLSEVTT